MGPAKTILLSQSLIDRHIADINAWLSTFAVSIDRPVKPGNWFFLVNDLTRFGLVSDEKPCGFGLAICDPREEMEVDWAERIMIALGFWPRFGLNMWAGCKERIDSLLMGHMMLEIMERFSGWLEVQNEKSYYKFEEEIELMNTQENSEKRQRIAGEKRKMVY